jgi:predicted tellurium resistance membrane protein TerC
MHFLLLLSFLLASDVVSLDAVGLAPLASSELNPTDMISKAARHLRARSGTSALQTVAKPVALNDSALAEMSSDSDEDDEEKEAEQIDAEIAETEHLIVAAWDVLRRASLPGSAEIIVSKQSDLGVSEQFKKIIASASGVEWYFLGLIVVLMVTVDVVILQHLPEIERMHAILLVLWLLIAASCCAEIWVREGQREGIAWASGYILELIFSIDNLFIINVIFQTLETPRRLMRKALFVYVLCGIFLRFAFHLGLAQAMYSLSCLPYILGAWLVYCGTQQVAYNGRCDEEVVGVTQTTVVRIFKKCMGDRFGEFYDEEGEATFVVSGSKVCMTLLGAAIVCLLIMDLFFSGDATLVKLRIIPNPYITFSSSVIALMTLRAAFFVVRDILSHLSLARYATGLVLCFAGAEMVAARFTEVSGMMSLLAIINIIMLMVTLSALKDNACPARKC